MKLGGFVWNRKDWKDEREGRPEVQGDEKEEEMERCVCVGINNNFGASGGRGLFPIGPSSITGPGRVRPPRTTNGYKQLVIFSGSIKKNCYSKAFVYSFILIHSITTGFTLFGRILHHFRAF